MSLHNLGPNHIYKVFECFNNIEKSGHFTIKSKFWFSFWKSAYLSHWLVFPHSHNQQELRNLCPFLQTCLLQFAAVPTTLLSTVLESKDISWNFSTHRCCYFSPAQPHHSWDSAGIWICVPRSGGSLPALSMWMWAGCFRSSSFHFISFYHWYLGSFFSFAIRSFFVEFPSHQDKETHVFSKPP